MMAAALVMGMAMFTSCEEEEENGKKPVLVDFESNYFTDLIDDPQYGGPLLYGHEEGEPVKYAWEDSKTHLASKLTAKYGGGYGYSEGGVAISNYVDDNIKEHNSYNYQLAVPVINGSSKNFAVAYCDASVYFSDGKARVIKSMEVCPTTYALGVAFYGDGYAAALTGENDFFMLTITGMNGEEKAGEVTVDMARGGNFLKEWKKVDLSKLGEVTSLSFTMSGSDNSSYGVKTPTYFAFDNVVVEM